MDNSEIYKGYKKISGDTAYINQYMEDIQIDGYSDWNINEYLILHNTDNNSESEMRFDGERFVALKLPPSRYIKGKNALQRCALDMLNNKDITICAILGGYGSGKTYLSMLMALYAVQEKGWQSKILGVREILGQGKDPGALPGDALDKSRLFFSPLISSLPGGEFEFEHLMQTGILETNIFYYLKGTTYNYECIICDEAEDLNEKQIKLVGTRVGKESRIFFCGDYKQSVINTTTNNALLHMCRELKGNPMFGCIVMEEDVRSDTSKLFAKLFED